MLKELMQLKEAVRVLLRRPWVVFPTTVMTRFGRDNGGLFAAGLAFFALLSFAPLILTSVACMAFFIHDPAHAAAKVQQIVQNLFPNGGAQDEVKKFLTQRLDVNGQVHSLIQGRKLAGVVGFVTLIWTSMQIFVNASGAMNAAFEVKEKRNWLVLRCVSLGLLISSGILTSLTLILSTLPSAIGRFTSFVPSSGVPLWVLTVAFEILAVLLNALMFVVIYRFLPSTEVTWKAAAVGGVAASVFWEVAKKGLASWLLKANHSVYGSLADLILFVLWIYYTMMILLIGAEVAAVYQASVASKRRKGLGGSSANPDEHSLAGSRPEVGAARRGKHAGAEVR